VDKELENTQKRLNILSNVLFEVLLAVKEVLPDHVNLKLAKIIGEWDIRDEEIPMAQDEEPEDSTERVH